MTHLTTRLKRFTHPITTILLLTAGLLAGPTVLAQGGQRYEVTVTGASVTVTVEADEIFDHFSVAAMLIPTNDGFFAINGVQGPSFDPFPAGFFFPIGDARLTLFSPAYDAGSERNDELCASIPGPNFAECKGPGGGAKVGGGEGYVHIHAGIHGIGDLNAAVQDWRNPVAKVTIRRVVR